MNSGVSVIVCCYNSEQRLPKTLEALAKQKTNVDWEVIVVDNNSTDNTAALATKLWKSFGAPTNLSVIKEPIPGLSSARMKGAKETEYEYLIFCDDDNWLCTNYVDDVLKFLEENPSIGIVGGIGTAVSDHTFPDWFEKHQHMYAVGLKRGLKNRSVVYGAGMGLRTDIFLELFEKVPSFVSDRTGDKLLSGGDDEICFRFRLKNFKIEVLPSLKFDHYIPIERLNKKYLERLSFWMGYSHGYLSSYIYFFNGIKQKNHLMLLVKDLVFLSYFFLKEKDKINRKYILGKLTMLKNNGFQYSKRTILNMKLIFQLKQEL